MDLACSVRGARQGHCSDPGGQTTKDLSVPYLAGYSFTFSSSFFLVHVLVILLWCFSQHSQRSTWTLVKGRNGHFSHLKKKKKRQRILPSVIKTLEIVWGFQTRISILRDFIILDYWTLNIFKVIARELFLRIKRQRTVSRI